MKATLTSIITQLKTITALKWIDEDFGQLEVLEQRPAVKFPCALITIDQASEDLGGGDRDVTNTVTVRLAHDRTADHAQGVASGTALASTMKKLDDAEAVRDALKGYTEVVNHFGPLMYLGFTTERRADGLAVKAFTFKETHEEAD